MIYLRLSIEFDILVFFTNLSLLKFFVGYLALFHLFLVIDNFEWFWMRSLYKNTQLMLVFLKAPFLFKLFIRYINDLPDNVICNIAIYVDDTILYSKCDEALDL